MFEKFTDEARHAVVAAQTEARTLGADRIGTDHLFLGVIVSARPGLTDLLGSEGYTRDAVLRNIAGSATLGDRDARALESIGIDLDAVRSSLEATFGEGALDRSETTQRGWLRRRTGHIAFAPASKRALQHSLREVIARNGAEIRCEHLVLGLISVGDAAFAAVVPNPDRLRERLVAEGA